MSRLEGICHIGHNRSFMADPVTPMALSAEKQVRIEAMGGRVTTGEELAGSHPGESRHHRHEDPAREELKAQRKARRLSRVKAVRLLKTSQGRISKREKGQASAGQQLMLRWWFLAFAIACLVLLTFFAASASGIKLLDDPTPLMRAARPIAAVAGVLLLVADVFLPVPSILVMIANGALFGVVGGALLSLVGSVGASLVGFAVGRAGNDLIRRFVTPREHERAGALLRRWGLVAIAVSRPIPVVAETVAILAGSSPLTWTQALLAAIAGSLVPSIAYAWAGASAQRLGMQAAIFAGVLATTALMFFAARRLAPQQPGE